MKFPNAFLYRYVGKKKKKNNDIKETGSKELVPSGHWFVDWYGVSIT